MRLENMSYDEREGLSPHQRGILERDWWRRLRADNPIPKAVREEVVERSGGVCEGCGSRRPLELHHATYELWSHKGPEGWIFGQEAASDLLALCRECHQEAHTPIAGGYERNPEEVALEKDHYEEQWHRD